VDAQCAEALRYFAGMPMADVASVMGIPLGTAKSRLNRALSTMRVMVAPGDPETEPFNKGHLA
jgi:DNA-directed RNA polymerase specialized sigma24 family protein